MAKSEFVFFPDETEEMWEEYDRLVKKWCIAKPKPPKISDKTGNWIFYLERPDRKEKTRQQRKARDQTDTFNPYSGTGLQAFNNSGLSVQERYAVEME